VVGVAWRQFSLLLYDITKGKNLEKAAFLQEFLKSSPNPY